MPKSINREYDKSKSVLTLSANFAVFVPGFANDSIKEGDKTYTRNELVEEAKKEGIYFNGTNIYKLNSLEAFLHYIGKKNTNEEIIEAKEAKLVKINDNLPDTDKAAYICHLTRSEIVLYDTTKYNYYKITSLGETKPENWENDKELKVSITTTAGDTQVKTTTYYSLTKYEKASLIKEYVDGDADPATLESVVKVLVGDEGASKDQQERHLGNKIAYELLKAGYTVFYRVLDSDKTALEQLNKADFWAPLKDKATYRIRYLTTGGCYDYSVYKLMADVVNFNNKTTLADADTLLPGSSGRGDCIALFDIDESKLDASYATPKDLATAFGNQAKLIEANKNGAIFAPRVVYVEDEDEVYGANDIALPCSLHFLLCAAKAQESYAEWYAAAGYTRGIANKTIKYTTYNFGDLVINTLAPREPNSYIGDNGKAINLILNERGSYYLWGNRTAASLDKNGLKFSHFLNIRQLCTTLKQVIWEASRRFTFDPNSDVLWINFVNAIRPTLERMKGDQGIAGYRISKVETTEKAVLKAIIRIVPIEAVEDFDISIYLEDNVEGLNIEADESEAN